MSRKKLVIAYHSENQDIAEQIEQEFGKYGYSFQHIQGEKESIGEELRGAALPSILLLSTNFFKSVNCMKNAMEWTKKMMELNLLMPVVVNGKEINAETGQKEETETIFRRVSDVIKYMNFWQDKYLDLRKKRRTASEEEEPTLSAQLEVTKDISAEIGEYLRFLKGKQPISYADFTANHHQAFFNFTQDTSTFQKLQQDNPIAAISSSEIVAEDKANEPTSDFSTLSTNSIEEKTVETPITPPKDQLKLDKDGIPIFEPATVPKSFPKKEETQPLESLEAVIQSDKAVQKELSAPHNDLEVDADGIPVFKPAPIPKESRNGMDYTEYADGEEEVKSEEKPRVQSGEGEDLVKIIHAASDEILEENEVETIPEPEKPPVNLASIPGMNLLAKQDAKDPNEEEDFINAIEAFSEIEEDDMDIELETVANLEDLPSVKNRSTEKTSINQLNNLVDTVVEEEAKDSLKTGEEEELADLMSVLGDADDKDTNIQEANKQENTAIPLPKVKEIIETNPSITEDLSTETPLPETVLQTAVSDDLSDLIDAVEEEETVVDTPIQSEEKAKQEPEESPKEEIFQEEEEDLLLDSDEVISRAYQYFEDEEWEGGLQILADGLTDQPENSDLRYQYALALAKHKNDLNGAAKQLEILLGFDQQHEEAFFLLGELAEVHQDYLMAKNYYEKVAALNNDFPEINYRLGVISSQYFGDKKEQAAEYLKKATKQDKHHADAHYRLAILLNEDFDNHLKAAKYFKKVLKIQPEHPFANYDLALLYHRLGDRALANIYYQKATEVNPELKTPANDEAFQYELTANIKSVPSLRQEGPNTDELERDMARLAEKTESLQAVPNIDNQLDTAIEDSTKRPELPKPPAKTILITGATSGIGKATAEVFAENGYRIIMTGRRAERLEELKADFENRFQSEVLTLPFDVRNVEEVKTAIDSLENEWREIDILLNNAGLAKGKGPIQEGKLEHWEQMIDTNVKGLLYMTRAIVPHMVNRKDGHIINIASSAGKEVYPGGNVYCATKHAVDALTRAMRIDLHEHNVRVSQVAPGMVEETEFSLVRYDGDAERAKIYEDFNPLTSRDVAEVVYFVATRPKHVNVQDVLLFGTQQANSIYTNRSGRKED